MLEMFIVQGPRDNVIMPATSYHDNARLASACLSHSSSVQGQCLLDDQCATYSDVARQRYHAGDEHSPNASCPRDVHAAMIVTGMIALARVMRVYTALIVEQTARGWLVLA